MSFRTRLSLFFVIIVVVPMIAVALVLFSLTKDSEVGKADAQIAQGLRGAFAEYSDARAAARVPLGRIARDPALAEALAAGRVTAVQGRVRALQRRYKVDALAAYDLNGRVLAYAGDRDAIAPAVARPATREGRRLGALAVSTTPAGTFARRVARLASLDIRVVRGGGLLAGPLGAGDGPDVRSGDGGIAGASYGGGFGTMDEPVGPPVRIGVFVPSGEIASAVRDSRLLIGAILTAFLLLALLSSVFV